MKTVAVGIHLMGVKEVREKLDDIREALCAASSEGWDSFSDETKEEIGQALETCDALLSLGEKATTA